MQPLLKIQSTPINIEYKVQRAQLNHKAQPAKMEVSRQRGSLNIQRTPSQLRVDTYETRASAGIKSPARSIQDFAEGGRTAGREATRTIAEEGNARLDSGGAKSQIADMVASRMIRPAETITAFIPSVRPEISFDPSSLSLDFQMDRLTFDWYVNHRPELEYVPGSIEFSVTQYPQVVIEYMGSPLYVPPSADPNYVPPDGIDTTI